MRLGHQLVLRMCVGALVAIFARLVHHHISAHLRFLHLLYFLVEFEPLLFAIELLLHGRPSGLAERLLAISQRVVEGQDVEVLLDVFSLILTDDCVVVS